MIPNHLDFRRLRHLPIEQILGARGIRLLRRGPRLVGTCPIHGGDNPRAFVVNTERNLWYCFTRCDAGGDAIDLVRRLERCSYKDAARYLASLAAGTPTAPRPLPGPRLHAAPRFLPYSRKLRLDPHADLLHRKGIHPKTARHFEVGHYDGRGFLAGCIGVRLHDRSGRPLGYAGRRLDLDEALRLGKWKLPPRLPRSRMLYNFHRVEHALPTTGVVLVECPWAVLRLAQLDIPAVGLLGIHLSEHQLQQLTSARRVVILLDGDQAGRLASERIYRQLGVGPDAVAHLPDGCDPDDLSDNHLADLVRPLFLS